MKLKNQEAFEEAVANNIKDDGYGSSCILFTCLWAGAMEREIAVVGVDKLPEFVEKCSSEADQALGAYGMTGFQYGMAVALLSECWEYGDQLRVWHNLKTQVMNEGERANEEGAVLNPALMNVRTEK